MYFETGSENYERSITVDVAPSAAFQTLTCGYSEWWTRSEGAFDRVGDRITFRFPPQISYWTFEAKRLIPNEYVELECVEAHHIIVEKPSASTTEWLGSLLRFQIEEIDGQTRITLTHDGLTRGLDCYEICKVGWDHFFVNSLRKYLNTGVGEPH